MEKLIEIMKRLVNLLTKLPKECIEIVKKLIENFLENIIDLIKGKNRTILKEKIIDKNDKDNLEIKNDSNVVEEDLNLVDNEKKSSNLENSNNENFEEKNQNNEKKELCPLENEEKKSNLENNNKNSIEKESLEDSNDIEEILNPSSEKEKTSLSPIDKGESTKENVNVEPGVTIEIPELTIVEPALPEPVILKPIKEKEILKKYLFDDIEKNEEVFQKIFKEVEILKNNLSLPEQDQKIFLKRIDNLEKELRKFKLKIDEEIEESDIDEDNYSDELVNRFISLLNENYKIVIENILKNIEYKKEKCYVEAFENFEKFLLNLDFEKGDFEIRNIDFNNKDIYYFTPINIETKNEYEDGKVKKITWQPYIMYYNSYNEEKKAYIPGQIILYRYGRLN